MLRRIGRKALDVCCAAAARRRSHASWSRGSYAAGPSGEAVVYGLIGANVAVFVAWHTVDTPFMLRHFTVSLPNLEAGRYHTVITHAFSHANLAHLGANLVALYFFGTALSRLMLGKQLLNLYLVGGVASALTDSIWKATSVSKGHWSAALDLRGRYRQQQLRDAPSLGASGAVNAVVSLFCCVFPREMIYLWFVIPIPAFLLGVLFVLHDFSSLKTEDNVSHAGHLGGVAVGLLYFLRRRYRF